MGRIMGQTRLDSTSDWVGLCQIGLQGWTLGRTGLNSGLDSLGLGWFLGSDSGLDRVQSVVTSVKVEAPPIVGR